jgi:hypothetical protein
MSAQPMIRDWRQQVRSELLPDLHGHQVNALAELSFAMTMAEHCHAGKLAPFAPGDARPASVERRLERLPPRSGRNWPARCSATRAAARSS